MSVKRILIAAFCAVIMVIAAALYWWDAGTNPDHFFNRHIIPDVQTYLDNYLGDGKTEVTYMSWNKHAEVEPESRFFVHATDNECGFHFFIFLNHDDKPAKTTYYSALFEYNFEERYEKIAEEQFQESVRCTYRTGFQNQTAIDISSISGDPPTEEKELFSGSASVSFRVARNYLDADEESIDRLADLLVEAGFNIWHAEFQFKDQEIEIWLR